MFEWPGRIITLNKGQTKTIRLNQYPCVEWSAFRNWRGVPRQVCLSRWGCYAFRIRLWVKHSFRLCLTWWKYFAYEYPAKSVIFCWKVCIEQVPRRCIGLASDRHMFSGYRYTIYSKCQLKNAQMGNSITTIWKLIRFHWIYVNICCQIVFFFLS